MITATNLFKSFGTRRVLRGLNMTINSGEIVALIGVNGAGKSTLLRILSTLSSTDAGVITLNGSSIAGNPIRARQQIGVVLHAPMLYGSLTGRENLRFFSRIFNLPDAEYRITQVLEEMNLTTRSNDLVRTYSRGMQQRLSIARAVLHNPAVLFMDEPLTGLDDDSISRLNHYLKQAAEQGKAILFATHELQHACQLATRIDILHLGAIRDSQPGGGLTPEKLHEHYHSITALDSPEPVGRRLP